MSTSKGNDSRTRSQRYQNKKAFKNDLYDTSPKIKLINSLDITGVCKRCKDILDWKIKYKKYKPLTAPKKCVNCDQKTIKHAYHIMCKLCAINENVCPKCGKNGETVAEEEPAPHNNDDLKNILDVLPERKRRTLLRCLNKAQSEKSSSTLEENHLKLTLEKLKINADKKSSDNNYCDTDSEDDYEDQDFNEFVKTES